MARKRQLKRSYDSKGFTGRKIYGDRNRQRIEEAIDMVPLKKDLSTLRPVGPLVAYAVWWITVKTKQGKEVSFPKVALGFNSETGEVDENVEDPYSELENTRLQVKYYINVIERNKQENEPRKRPKPTSDEDASGFKEKGSPTWTPVGAIGVPPTVAQQMQALATQNRHKGKNKSGAVVTKSFDLTHPKYGRDILLSYDKDSKSAANYYNLSLADPSPLTEEEMDYLIWDLEGLADKEGCMCPESLKEARREVESLSERTNEKEADTESQDDLAEDFVEEDDDLDDDIPWDDMDEDETPRRAKKNPRKKREPSRSRSSGSDGTRRRRRSSGDEKSLKPTRKRRKLRSE